MSKIQQSNNLQIHDHSYAPNLSSCEIWSWHNSNDQSCFPIILCNSNIRSFIYSLVFFTIFGYVTNSQYDQLPVGSIAQLVEHCISIADGLESCSSLNFFQPQILQLLISVCITASYISLQFKYMIFHLFTCVNKIYMYFTLWFCKLDL